MIGTEKITVIKPRPTIGWYEFKEVLDYRELLYFLTWKDIKVRYKQTFIGIAWAIFQPLITMVVFTIFFGKLVGISSSGVPYPIFVYVGLLFWQFFSGSLGDTANALVSNQSIVTKVYFPRIILPLSAVLSKFVDFFFASLVLIGLLFYYGYTPNLTGLLVLPLLLVISFLAATGGGLVLASINVKYRDVRYALPFFIQLLLFVTPVIYPPSLAGKYSWILAINPMTGVIKGARAALLGTEPINWLLLMISLVTVLVLMVVGIYVFKRTEGFFADLI